MEVIFNWETFLKKIINNLNFSENLCTETWNYLKTKFSHERNKTNDRKSGAGREENYVSDWKFFDLMQFYEQALDPGHSSGNLDGNKYLNSKKLKNIFIYEYIYLILKRKKFYINVAQYSNGIQF